MMIRVIFFIFILSVSSPTLADEHFAIDLAQDHVDITTGFDGAKITLFGMKDGAGDVAIVVSGPEKDMSVRKKNNILGIWINTENIKFKNVPVFYDYALSTVDAEKLDPEFLSDNNIGLKNLPIEAVNVKADDARITNFKSALFRNKITEGVFPEKPKKIEFINDSFFKAQMYIPSNVPVGEYKVRAFVFENGKVDEANSLTLRVAQIGLSAFLYQFAKYNGFFYGFLCVLIAVFSGWTINALRSKA